MDSCAGMIGCKECMGADSAICNFDISPMPACEGQTPTAGNAGTVPDPWKDVVYTRDEYKGP